MVELVKLKKQYSALQSKYKLPKFSDLNKDFEIEKLQDRETEHLLRGVRRTMIEKIANVVRFLELLMNPSESPTPMFIYAILKGITPETKSEIEKLYKELSNLELGSLGLDVSHDEKEEADFVKAIYQSWNKHQPGLKKITQKLNMTWKKDKKADRGYLG